MDYQEETRVLSKEEQEEETAFFEGKKNELKICITLNGSELCRPYFFESVEDILPEKVGSEVMDILDTLKESDKASF